MFGRLNRNKNTAEVLSWSQKWIEVLLKRQNLEVLDNRAHFDIMSFVLKKVVMGLPFYGKPFSFALRCGFD
jgi:hypothetical protein